MSLTQEEVDELSRSKILTSMQTTGTKGGRAYRPYVFTEQGIYMLMTVLKGELIECQKLITDELIEKLTKLVDEANAKDQESIELKRLRKEVKSINDKIEKLITKIEDGVKSDRIVERLKAREDELAVLKKQLALEESKQILMDPFYVKKFLQEMRTGDITDKRYRKMIINVFIEKIYLYDDYIRIFLKYVQGRGSGTKEVADIEKYFDEEYKTPESMSDIIPVEHRFINDPPRPTKRGISEPICLSRRIRCGNMVRSAI